MDVDLAQIWYNLMGMQVGTNEDEDALEMAPQWMRAPGQTTRTTPTAPKETTRAKKQTAHPTIAPTMPSKPEPHQGVNALWANEVMCIGEAHTNDPKSVQVPYTFTNGHMTTEEHALLDSGATDNFIDKRTAQ